MTVNTRGVARRSVKLDSLEELWAELGRLEAAHGAGTLAHTGNWTPGQVLQHLAIYTRCSLDGFPPGRPAAPVRWAATVLLKRRAVAGRQPPPGIKLPVSFAYLAPEPDVTFAEGLGQLRGTIRRVRDGERFSQASPLFGPLTHEQWTRLHLGHCELHLSFLDPG